MSIRHQIQRKWIGPGGQTLNKTESLTADGESNRDFNVIAGEFGREVAYSLVPDELQAFYMTSNGDLTVTPYDTSDNPMTAIPLQADIPFVWTIGSGLDNPFSDEVSKLVCDNAGEDDCAVSLRSLFDSTASNPVSS